MLTQTELNKILEQINIAFEKIEKRIKVLEEDKEKVPQKRVTKTAK